MSRTGWGEWMRADEPVHSEVAMNDIPNRRTHVPHQTERVYDLDPVGKTAVVRRILIVEDEVSMIDAIRDYLQSYGYEVDSAYDGVEGIKKVMEHEYSVIICDMVMPNLAGDMFYKAVDRIKPHLCKRFIFITGYKDDRKVDAFIRSIRGLVLWKPFQFPVLMETIQAVEKMVARTSTGPTQRL
jgi:CheY-like chemotaxis protein